MRLRWVNRKRPVDAFVIEGSVSETYRVLQVGDWEPIPMTPQEAASGAPTSMKLVWRDVPVEDEA